MISNRRIDSLIKRSIGVSLALQHGVDSAPSHHRRSVRGVQRVISLLQKAASNWGKLMRNLLGHWKKLNNLSVACSVLILALCKNRPAA